MVGEVSIRPEGNANPELPTGAIEVMASEVEVLSTAAPLPFPIDDRSTVGEEVRLRIDLGAGAAAATAWGCNMTSEYVSINADYTT